MSLDTQDAAAFPDGDVSGEKSPVQIYDLIGVMLDQTASVAWAKLGLHPDMITGTISPDLDQAKVAIDLVGHLAQVLDPQLDESDRRTVANLLRDLRLNYVSKTGGNS